jgi:hypothetical protein
VRALAPRNKKIGEDIEQKGENEEVSTLHLKRQETFVNRHSEMRQTLRTETMAFGLNNACVAYRQHASLFEWLVY